MSDGSDRPKVTIVPEHTKVTSGTDVQEKLIVAARVFSDLLKPTFGPRGLDKMLYKTDGTTAVTNDGAKIVAELLVRHPAAKMMVSMAESQEEECGDGVTTTMLICGSLLIEANNLLRKGLHPLTLVEGYHLSFEASRAQLHSDAQDPDEQMMLSVAETALRGKGAELALEHFSTMIVEAIRTVYENRGEASAEHVCMFKSGTGGLRDSRLVRGFTFRRRVQMDSLPNNLKDPKVACLDGDLKIREMSRDVEVKISNAEQLDSFVGAEQQRKEAICQSIATSGAAAILCSGEIDRDILHYLSDVGILAIGDLDSREIRNAADALGARIIESPLDFETADLGQCGGLSWERREESDTVEDIIRIEDCPSPTIVTIEVGGAGETGTEEVIRGIHDSLRATSLAMEEKVLPGAGASHCRMAHAVRSESETQGGRERLAMEAYARALETIPATLAENGGGEPLDRVLELRATAREGSDQMGVSAEGKTWIVEGVWHPFSVIERSLESATETAMGMLRIDQVISSRGD
ncbi:MAG TPA: TCP-1/cpn60 chaperonin family protein [Candidatus Thalassarchaeaceae archaeon]|nr:TCP-1/cpn60 chaperonin family protein [Candidatus Thalassarchaeaceae archaeon]|tara:strand:+ start:9834 stop:11402 length:1569 start_codon:yes stop_codon:yes gene_type:complete